MSDVSEAELNAQIDLMNRVLDTGDLSLLPPNVAALTARKLEEMRAQERPPAPRPLASIPFGPHMRDLLGSLCRAAGVSAAEWKSWYYRAKELDAALVTPPAPKKRPAHLRLVRDGDTE